MTFGKGSLEGSWKWRKQDLREYRSIHILLRVGGGTCI